MKIVRAFESILFLDSIEDHWCQDRRRKKCSSTMLMSCIFHSSPLVFLWSHIWFKSDEKTNFPWTDGYQSDTWLMKCDSFEKYFDRTSKVKLTYSAIGESFHWIFIDVLISLTKELFERWWATPKVIMTVDSSSSSSSRTNDDQLNYDMPRRHDSKQKQTCIEQR